MKSVKFSSVLCVSSIAILFSSVCLAQALTNKPLSADEKKAYDKILGELQKKQNVAMAGAEENDKPVITAFNLLLRCYHDCQLGQYAKGLQDYQSALDIIIKSKTPTETSDAVRFYNAHNDAYAALELPFPNTALKAYTEALKKGRDKSVSEDESLLLYLGDKTPSWIFKKTDKFTKSKTNSTALFRFDLGNMVAKSFNGAYFHDLATGDVFMQVVTMYKERIYKDKEETEAIFLINGETTKLNAYSYKCGTDEDGEYKEYVWFRLSSSLAKKIVSSDSVEVKIYENEFLFENTHKLAIRSLLSNKLPIEK